MNENAKAWIRALRSGDFRQCKGALRIRSAHDRSGFCCLGVATELYRTAHPDEMNVVRDPSAEDGYLYSYLWEDEGRGLSSDADIPPPVAAWLGLSNEVMLNRGELAPPDAHLMGLNDTWEYDFSQIADWLEEHADRVFE